MTSFKPPSRVSGFIIGLLLLVCLSPAVVLLSGNDGEPKQEAERKAGEKPSSGALVEGKIGSDSPDKPTDSAKGSVSQSQPDDDGAVPEQAPKQKVFRGRKSMTDQSAESESKSAPAGKKGTKRGDVGGPMGGSDMQGGMAPGSGAPPAMGPMGKGRMGGSAMDAMPPMGGGGMGGSGMGGMRPMGGGRSAMGMGSREVPRAAKLYVEGVSIILKQSETGDTLWGYSEKLGKWSKLAIPKGPDLLTPVVGANVGVFLGGGRIYAFSGLTGRWAELKTAASPTVSASKISVTDGDQVFIFSDVHGRWSSNAEASDDQPATADPSDPDNLKTSSLLVDETGRQIEMGDFDSDGRLDVIVHPTPGRPRTIKYYDKNGRLDRTVPESSKKMSAADLLAAFQERSQESERRTIQAGEEYREALRLGGEKGPRTIELRSTLAKLVTESFDRRQQAQRLDAEILRRRLRRVDERLTEREKFKSRIIQHRLEELQNTSVRWDAETSKRVNRPDKSDSIAEKAAPVDDIREFAGRGSASANVGIVSNVSDDGWIELSPAKVFGIRAGDELEVIRPDRDSKFGSRFARIAVVEAQPDTARARMVESTRTQINGKYVWERIRKGYTVSRPIESEANSVLPTPGDAQHADNDNTVRDLLADSIRPHFIVREPGKSAGDVLRVGDEPVVCVRGVLPWEELMQNPAVVARNTPDRQRPAVVELSDFKIERQEAPGTPAEWDGVPWIVCSIDKSIDVLKSCEDFDKGSTPEEVQSPALTSPLPRLIDGLWGERVLHPTLGGSPADGPANYVLFRFLDFDVKAGQSYRYRVKLLYTASKTADVQPGPWSEPSTVASVTDSTE